MNRSAKKSSIAFLGCGNMGKAIVDGLSQTEMFSQIYIYDPNLSAEKDSDLFPKAAILSTASEAVLSADVVLLAVKPYVLFDLLKEIDTALADKKPMLISIAAGIKLEQLANKLSVELPLVRVMPNIACTVRAGSSAVFSENDQALQLAVSIFETVGEVVVSNSEEDIDIFTALSAGGPAFLCEVVEGLVQGGEKMGLSRGKSLKAAIATMYGTAQLLKQSSDMPLIWRDRVATPGGTTEQGLAVLHQSNIVEVFSEAVQASTKRARENLANKK